MIPVCEKMLLDLIYWHTILLLHFVTLKIKENIRLDKLVRPTV